MLTGTLDLDSHPFVAAMRIANNAVERMQSYVTRLTTTFAGLKVIGDGVVNAFGRMKETIDLAGTLNDLSAETGETVANLTLFRQMLKDIRLGAEGVDRILPKWQKALAGVNEEGKSTTKVLGELGVTAADVEGLSIVDQIEVLGAAFREVEEPAKRAAMAQDLFGKSGAKLVSLLVDPNAVRNARNAVGGFGEQMERQAGVLDSFGDALDHLSNRFHEFIVGVLSVIAPKIEGMANALNEINLEKVGQVVGEVILKLISLVEMVVKLTPVIVGMGAQWLATAAMTRLAAMNITASIGGIVGATVVGARSIIAALGPVGLAVAGLTYLWQKSTFGKMPEIGTPNVPSLPNFAAQRGMGGIESAPVSSLTKVAGTMLGGALVADPLVSEQKRTNQLLQDIRSRMAPPASTVNSLSRPDLHV